jgi:ribosomal protein S18 acetylase RimI-like enzyme
VDNLHNASLEIFDYRKQFEPELRFVEDEFKYGGVMQQDFHDYDFFALKQDISEDKIKSSLDEMVEFYKRLKGESFEKFSIFSISKIVESLFNDAGLKSNEDPRVIAFMECAVGEENEWDLNGLPKNLQIVDLDEENIDEATELNVEVFEITKGAKPQYIRYFINPESKRAFWFNAKLDGKIVGTAAMYLCNDFAFITDVTVSSEHRRKKIATKLFYHLHELAKSNGTPKIMLNAEAGAVALYEKIGYKSLASFYVYALNKIS